MKILIITHSADSAGIWHRFKREGHNVSVYFSDPECKDSMKGVVERVDSLSSAISQKPDFVLVDMVGSGPLCDRLKKAGVPIIGGSSLCDNLELKREYGIKMAEKYGIPVPKSEHFKTIAEAKKYVSENGKPIVVKLDGNVSAASSHVAHDAKQALEYLEYVEDSGTNQGATVTIQDFVKGIEVSTEMWLSNGRLIYPLNGTFEEKKLMPGNLGPNTGCMSSCVFPYLSSSPKLAQKTILKILPMFEEIKYSGCVDVNCIIREDNHEPAFLEWTARLGYSAFYAMSAMIDGSLSEWLRDVAHGKAKRVPLNHSWGSAIRAIIPPAPNEWPDMPEVSKKAYSGIAGQIVKFEDSRYVYPIEELMKDKKGRWVTCGLDGTVAEACGVGKTLDESWQAATKRFESIEVAGKMGRLDGIKRTKEESLKLRSWGYDIPNPAERKNNEFAR